MRCAYFVLVPAIVVVLAVIYDLATTHKIPSTFQAYQETLGNLSATPSHLLTVMTFNLRWADLEKKDHKGTLSWSLRRQRVADTIKAYAPSFVGTQECKELQQNDLMQLLGEDYESVGPTKVAIVYHNKKLRISEHGEFLLAKEPDPRGKPLRPAMWATFQVLDGAFPNQEILVVNTHNDPFYESRRRMDVASIREQVVIRSKNGSLPVFVTGDFNTCPGQFSHRFLTGTDNTEGQRLTDTWEECERLGPQACRHNGVTSSYHHFLGAKFNGFCWRVVQYALFTTMGFLNLPDWNRFQIDWILYKNADNSVGPALVPRFASVVVEEWDYRGETASDHFPVVAVFSV